MGPGLRYLPVACLLVSLSFGWALAAQVPPSLASDGEAAYALSKVPLPLTSDSAPVSKASSSAKRQVALAAAAPSGSGPAGAGPAGPGPAGSGPARSGLAQGLLVKDEPAYRLYQLKTRQSSRKPSVILVTGVGFSARAYWPSAGGGLAGQLGALGCPIWVLEPRWEALSQAHPGAALETVITGLLPEVMGYVRPQAPEGVVLAGFSTGASMVAGYLGQTREPVRGALLLAPVLGDRYPSRVHGTLASLLSEEKVEAVGLDGLWQSVPGWTGESWHSLLLSNRNAPNRPEERAALASRLEPIPAGLVKELRSWFTPACCRTGSLDLRETATRLQVPTLVLAGGADNLAPPEEILETLRPASSHIEFHLLARTSFVAFDYGHLDLLFSPTLRRDLRPLFRRWLSHLPPLAARTSLSL